MPAVVLLCTIAFMSKADFKISPKVKPEIRAFVARADAVAQRMGIRRFTMSRKLFGDTQGRTLENLAKGGGANVIGWFDAHKRLAAFEAELQAESAA